MSGYLPNLMTAQNIPIPRSMMIKLNAFSDSYTVHL